VHAAFEIAVAGQNGRDRQVAGIDRFGDGVGQRARISDAGRAAIAREREAELVERGLQARRDHIVGHDLAAGGERRFDPGLDFKALGDGVAREQPGGHEDRRVRGVRARGDRGDDDVAVLERVAARGNLHAVLGVFGAREFGQRFFEACLGGRQQHAVLRALRACERRLDRAHIELHRVGEHRVGRIFVAPHALGFGVGFDKLHARRIAAGEVQIVDRFLVDREEAAGGAVFGRHVGDRRTVGQRQRVEAGAVELDEFVDDTLLAQQLRDHEDEVGRGHAFAQAAGEFEADHFGDQHRHGLAQHRGFGLDAANAPAEHGHAVHHRRVAVGAHERVGIGVGGAVAVLRPDGLGEVFEIDLVANARAGRNHAEIREGGSPPAQEGVALAVAFVFKGNVLGEAVGLAEIVDHHRVVDHEIDRRQRIDLFGVAAHVDHRVAHRGQIDHGRHAGEVLHQHARRAVGDFARGFARLKPARHGFDVVGRDRAPVFPAQQVLEQNFERIGQPLDAFEARRRSRFEAEIAVVFAVDRQGAARFERILSETGHEQISPFCERRRTGLPARVAGIARLRAGLKRCAGVPGRG